MLLRNILLFLAPGLTIVAIFAAMTFPALAQSGVASRSELEKKEFIAAIPRHWPPQYDIDENGKPVGFAIDVMNAVATRAGLEIKYLVKQSFPLIDDALRSGEADLVPNSGIVLQRANEFAFTDPVETFNVSVFVRSDTHDLVNEEDLIGRSLGVVRRNISEYMFGSRTDINVTIFPDVKSALLDLLAGRIDAIVYPTPVLLSLVRKVGVEERVKIVGAPLREVKRGIRVRKEDTALLAVLNKAVGEFVGTPEYQRIYVKWYGEPKPYISVYEITLIMSGLLVVVLVVMAWWRYNSVVRLNRKLTASEAALLQSEEQFRELAENIREVFWMTNIAKNEIIYISAGYEDIWGRPLQSLYDDPSSFIAAIHPEDRPRVAAAIPLQVKGSYDVTYRVVRPDGTERWVRDQAFPVKDENGKVYRIAGIAEDITELIAQNEQLRQAQKMEAVGQLTGGISHDFNNLLAVLIGNTELLEELVRDNPEALEYVQVLDDTIDRAASLTQRLLAFSRQQTLSPKPTDIGDLLLGLEDLLRRTLGERIDFRIRAGRDLWNAMIDGSQLDHAIVNLALNASDAMPNGGKLTIEASNTELDETYASQHTEVTPGDYIEIAVSDDGCGIAPDLLEKVFEPFFTTKEVGEGSGLGLSMVYGFVKQSNGHITVYSEVGRGTTVKLYLPRARSIGAEGEEEDESEAAVRGSERILVVEDDPLVRETPMRILRSQGYVVSEAENGKDAVNILKSGQPFDLLFTDLVLPGDMNGVDIAREAVKLCPNIKVLFTTGYAENAVFAGGKLEDGAMLVNKPYRRGELLKKVRLVLDSASG